MSDPRQPDGQPPGAIPPGFRRDPDPAAMHQRAEAEALAALTGQQAPHDQAVHDGLEKMLREDPALLLQKLPELYGPAIQQIVGRAVKASRWCSECVGLRIAWNAKHAAELEQAWQFAAKMAGITDPSDPRTAQLDVGQFLPENLRPGAEPDGMPLIFDSVTTVQGTDVCTAHHPAAAGVAAVVSGRQPILIARGNLTPAMIREAGGIPGAFGMAGMPAA